MPQQQNEGESIKKELSLLQLSNKEMLENAQCKLEDKLQTELAALQREHQHALAKLRSLHDQQCLQFRSEIQIVLSEKHALEEKVLEMEKDTLTIFTRGIFINPF